MKGGINIVELAAICYAGVAALREATGGGRSTGVGGFRTR